METKYWAALGIAGVALVAWLIHKHQQRVAREVAEEIASKKAGQ